MDKTLGQVAFEAAYLDMGEAYEWDRIPAEEHGHWEASALAVIAEHERRKAATVVPTDRELDLWNSANRVRAVNSYKERTGSTLADSYRAIDRHVRLSKESGLNA